MFRVSGRSTAALAATILASALVLSAPIDRAVAGSPVKPAAAKASQDIISIGGDVTEILYALDLGHRIAAVDTTSLHPPAALKEKPNVGYMRALSAEGVLAIPAKLIIASDGAGPPAAVKVLKASSMTYIGIPDTPSAAGIVDKVAAVAKATESTDRGEILISSIRAEFELLASKRDRIEQPLSVLFVLNVSSGRIIVGGKGTSADGLFELAGAKNAAGAVNGFKPVTAEALVAMAPDAIITMKRRGQHQSGALLKVPGIQLLQASKKGRIREVDGQYMLGFGPRTPRAAHDVMVWLYPDLADKKG